MARKVKTLSAGLTILLSIIIMIVGVAVGFCGSYYILRPVQSKADILKSNIQTSGEISFHFLELGNANTGDCTYIKAGDVDILIDAGSKVNSIPTLENYLNQHIVDNKIEYVIVTHAHEDHYAGFATASNKNSIFDDYEIGMIIDFAQVEKGKDEKAQFLNYQRELSEAVSRGATHYTALQCVREIDGAKKTYNITDDVTMTILEHKFYSQISAKENNHSVCTLFTQGTRNFLFTGDLEEPGEISLVEMNPDLPHCELFKAGHHGSGTSSNDVLLDVITPDICCVCCCAGNYEYAKSNETTFPTQEFINRISKHTDSVYVTTLGKIVWNENQQKYDSDGFTSFNGNIVVKSTSEGVTVNCSNNNTKLKDTDWFRERRTMPSAWAT